MLNSSILTLLFVLGNRVVLLHGCDTLIVGMNECSSTKIIKKVLCLSY